VILGVSLLRNPHLADVFYRLRLIEAYGTGMLKIKECYADCNVKPIIEVTDNAFKMTLPNLNYAREHELAEKPIVRIGKENMREEKIIGLFEKRETIDRKDVEKALGVSQSTAILAIRGMIKKVFFQRRTAENI
jgi:ATP-dependent DNA helicase RecG